MFWVRFGSVKAKKIGAYAAAAFLAAFVVCWFWPREMSVRIKDSRLKVFKVAWHPAAFTDRYRSPGGAPVHWIVRFMLLHGMITHSLPRPIGAIMWEARARSKAPALVVFCAINEEPTASGFFNEEEQIVTGPETNQMQSVWGSTKVVPVELLDQAGRKAYQSLCYGTVRTTVPGEHIAIFKLGYPLTNGVYHLRIQGETNYLADLKVRGLPEN